MVMSRKKSSKRAPRKQHGEVSELEYLRRQLTGGVPDPVLPADNRALRRKRGVRGRTPDMVIVDEVSEWPR
jgi:hypothetical protein